MIFFFQIPHKASAKESKKAKDNVDREERSKKVRVIIIMDIIISF